MTVQSNNNMTVLNSRPTALQTPERAHQIMSENKRITITLMDSEIGFLKYLAELFGEDGGSYTINDMLYILFQEGMETYKLTYWESYQCELRGATEQSGQES